MYILDRNDMNITNLVSAQADANYPITNILTKYTGQVTKSTSNTMTINFDIDQLSDIVLYNVGAIDGSVTVKDATTSEVLISETIDFFTARSISLMSVDAMTYDSNICILHGQQFFTNVKVEITLQADVGNVVSIGCLAAGIFISYGMTQTSSITPKSQSFSVVALPSEYQAVLNLLAKDSYYFVLLGQSTYEGESIYLSYGKSKISSGHREGSMNLYTLEMKG